VTLRRGERLPHGAWLFPGFKLTLPYFKPHPSVRLGSVVDIKACNCLMFCQWVSIPRGLGRKVCALVMLERSDVFCIFPVDFTAPPCEKLTSMIG
jgi:hypothetical protein